MAERIITKRCSFCKQSKTLSEFHYAAKSKLKRQSICKKCNREYQRKYMRKYHKTQKGREIANRYRKSEKGLCVSRQAYKRNRIKKIASATVRGKVRNGKMPHAKSFTCNYCPNQASEYHHHKGYKRENWLDVIPICIPCHSKIHNS